MKQPTIDDAVEELRKKYEEVVSTNLKDWVYSPIAYALYHTWEKFDKEYWLNKREQTDGKR